MSMSDLIVGNLRYAIKQAGPGGTVTLTAELAGELLDELDAAEEAPPADTIGEALRAVQEHFAGEDDPVFADLCDLVNRAAEEHARTPDRTPQLDMANAEIERLTAELATMSAALQSATSRADGLAEKVAKLRGMLAARAPADASLEARAHRLAVAFWSSHPAEPILPWADLDEAERRAWLAAAAVDASRPGLTEEQAPFGGWPAEPRATLHAGDPASLAEVVAASAREPHADVVLQALHVSGGAAAIGVQTVDTSRGAVIVDLGKPETCGEICPPGLVAQGRACKEPKGHAPPHCADVAEGSGSCWFPGYTGTTPPDAEIVHDCGDATCPRRGRVIESPPCKRAAATKPTPREP